MNTYTKGQRNGLISLSQLKKETGLDKDEFNFALGFNKKNNFIKIFKEKETMVKITKKGLEYCDKESSIEKQLRILSENNA